MPPPMLDGRAGGKAFRQERGQVLDVVHLSGAALAGDLEDNLAASPPHSAGDELRDDL